SPSIPDAPGETSEMENVMATITSSVAGALAHSPINSQSFLRKAANILKGELAECNTALKETREAQRGAQWRILCNLICHAAQEVFTEGYSRQIASKFREDWVKASGLSAKQASKWTESISAALGVRGLRKGLKPLEGLMAVGKEGTDEVDKYLKAREITSFNEFMAATRTE